MLEVEAEVRITSMEFTPELNDPGSPIYIETKQSLEDTVSKNNIN